MFLDMMFRKTRHIDYPGYQVYSVLVTRKTVQPSIFPALAAVFILSVCITGCVSTIRLQVERLPALNTSGIHRIAVMPFNAAGRDPVSREMTAHLTTAARNRIQGLNHFTLVDSAFIEQLQRRDGNLESFVDALFTGQITLIESKDSSSERLVTDRSTGTTRTVTTYVREVTIEFNYYFTRARDGSLIGPAAKRGTARSSSENADDLASTSSLLRDAVDNQLRTINQDLVPHTVIEHRRLSRESSKDKELRALMKYADSLVRAGNYRSALETYLDIYGSYGNIAAALNVSILHQALGETQTAAIFMQAVQAQTGNPSASTELARLNRILSDRARIASDFGAAQNPIDRVVIHASEEIRRVLPSNARVWIFHAAARDTMVSAVVDNLTADFIRRRIDIVDREHTALIEAEQLFQMSGLVSDDEFVGIANAAGANTMVIIGITGIGDMRRLQLRVLDIERRLLIFQSDTGSSWRL